MPDDYGAEIELLSQRVTDAIDELKRLKDDAEDRAKLADAFDDFGDPRPLDDADETRVVTVKAVVMCLHLMAARVAFRTWSSILKSQLTKMAGIANNALGFVGSLFAKIQGVAGFLTKLVTVALTILKVFSHALNAQKVRDSGFAVRGELVGLHLESKVTKRCTTYVSTRHPMDVQRRPNKSWKPC